MLKLKIGNVHHSPVHYTEGNLQSSFVPIQGPKERVHRDVFRDFDNTNRRRSRTHDHGNFNRSIMLWHDAAILPHLSPIQKSATHPFPEIDLFHLFALCFGQPSQEFVAWLSGNDSRVLWKQLARHFGTDLKLTRQDQFLDFSAYEAAYVALFEVGVPEPPVPLLESAHSKRVVPQEIVLDCVNYYDVLELRPSSTAFPADHLVTQLEFLAAVRFLQDNSDSANTDSLRRLEHDFVERHLLSWLPAAQENLCQLRPPIFPTLFALLTVYLKRQVNSSAVTECDQSQRRVLTSCR